MIALPDFLIARPTNAHDRPQTKWPGRCPAMTSVETSSVAASALEHVDQSRADARRRRRHLDAGRFHRGDLRFRVALAAGDDRAGVAHAAARRRRASGDEAGHRLLAAALGLVLEELRRVLLGRAADLADHDDRRSLRIGKEHLQHVDKLGAFDRIAADADGRGLAEALARGLEHRFVGQRAGARHDPDRAGLEDVARHDADLALARGHHARAVRADEARLRAGQRALDAHHVHHRDALGDGDDQRDLRLDRFADRVGRAGRRHVDHRRLAAGFLARFRDGVEDRQIEMLAAAFAGRGAADHLGAVLDGLLGVKGAVLAGEALADDLRVLVDEDGHQAASFTAFTIFCAASSRSSPDVTLRPDSAMIFLPSSTLVPSSRTTSGTFRPTSLTAATTPSAMTSHFMMPPKMLTRIPFTFGSEVMILNAAATLSLVAEPPTSRKFAGAMPYSLMMSIDAMARPAPLTMQPIEPSSAM